MFEGLKERMARAMGSDGAVTARNTSGNFHDQRCNGTWVVVHTKDASRRGRIDGVTSFATHPHASDKNSISNAPRGPRGRMQGGSRWR